MAFIPKISARYNVASFTTFAEENPAAASRKSDPERYWLRSMAGGDELCARTPEWASLNAAQTTPGPPVTSGSGMFGHRRTALSDRRYRRRCRSVLLTPVSQWWPCPRLWSLCLSRVPSPLTPPPPTHTASLLLVDDFYIVSSVVHNIILHTSHERDHKFYNIILVADTVYYCEFFLKLLSHL